jgi:hypothetical protein
MDPHLAYWPMDQQKWAGRRAENSAGLGEIRLGWELGWAGTGLGTWLGWELGWAGRAGNSAGVGGLGTRLGWAGRNSAGLGLGWNSAGLGGLGT